MSDSFFRKLWMEKLTPHTTQILATYQEVLDLKKTAEIADKISDAKTIHGINVAVPHDTPVEDVISKLHQQIIHADSSFA